MGVIGGPRDGIAPPSSRRERPVLPHRGTAAPGIALRHRTKKHFPTLYVRLPRGFNHTHTLPRRNVTKSEQNAAPTEGLESILRTGTGSAREISTRTLWLLPASKIPGETGTVAAGTAAPSQRAAPVSRRVPRLAPCTPHTPPV